jgi:peroxiredoxin
MAAFSFSVAHWVARAASFLMLALLSHGALGQQLVAWRGDPTPALMLEDMKGNSINLANLRGKTVLINFWATWCAPCVEEMPSIQGLKARFNQEKFEVLAVNVGESKERVEAFLKKVPVNFSILFDPQGDASRNWKVHGFPTTFILGPDGRIRYYHVGDLDWSQETIVDHVKGIR